MTSNTEEEYVQRIEGRKDEVIDNLKKGIIETFDASKDSSEIGKSVRLIFEDTEQVKKTQFELLGNLLEEESPKTHELIIVNQAGQEGYDTYSVGHIQLDMIKYKSIKKMFNEVEIEITTTNESERMPYNIFKRLSSNEYLSEDEIQEKYNNLTGTLSIEDIIKRNAKLD